MADRPQRPKSPTKRGHESTSYDTPSALRRAQPASDAPNRFVDDTGDADDATSVYDSQKVPKPPAIQVKSMKAPGEPSSGQRPLPDDARPRPAIPQVKLRAMSEVASQASAPQQALGYLAPPRNPADVRARKTRDFIVWGSVCVILACFVALGIWFVAK